MKKVLSVLVFCLPLFCFGTMASLLTSSMDKTFYSQKGAAFRVVYSSFDVVKYARLMNVNVPTSFRLNNLSIFVDAKNITDKELALVQTKLPLSIEATSFTLTIQGKSKRLTIKADKAVLTPINTISLKGRVRLISTKTVDVGESADISLQGRMLILTVGKQKFGFKF